MAAPSGTKWGEVAGGYGRIGIYATTTSNGMETTVTIQVWFSSKYSVSDTGNTLYLDNLAASGSATSAKGATNIQTTVATGDPWPTANEVLLTGKSYTYTHVRGKSTVKRYIHAKLTDVDRVGATMYANTTVSIPILASYPVSYNENGGTGAPDNQTKWGYQTLTLSSTKPTRTGYSFQGWATSADGDVAYKPGANYTANAPVTLYAVWKADTYTVTYDDNGGTGAPSKQTKTYGVTLKLSTTIPKRTNYNFLGWATTKTATTAQYSAGDNYTVNKAVTLYAVWELAYVKPRITIGSISRCDENGNITDSGTYACFSLTWACDRAFKSATIEFESESADKLSINLSEVNSQNGTVDKMIVGNGVLRTDVSYTVKLTITDELGYSTEIVSLPGTNFVIDILAEGKGISFNKPAELEGVADIGFQTRLLGGLRYVLLTPETNLNNLRTPGFYIGENVTDNDYRCGDDNFPFENGTFTLEILSMGDNGQVLQRLTSCNRSTGRALERIWYASAGWSSWVCVSDYRGQLLWSGSYYMSDSHTAELLEPVSKQKNGIVLVFSLYDDVDKVGKNQEMFEFFIPKYTISAHSGSGRNFNLCGMFGNGVKYLYLHDTKVVGYSKNSQEMTIGGITYTNNRYVLRYVIGV